MNIIIISYPNKATKRSLLLRKDMTQRVVRPRWQLSGKQWLFRKGSGEQVSLHA
jgi:hypothetical protein